MWDRSRNLVCFIGLLCLVVLGAPAVYAETLDGKVVDRSGKPVPGLTVSLVHPIKGRSSPRFTNSKGEFSFSNVPRQSKPYYLEIYWGKKLISRKRVRIRGKMKLPTIRFKSRR